MDKINKNYTIFILVLNFFFLNLNQTFAQGYNCDSTISKIHVSYSKNHSSEGQIIRKGDTLFNVFRYDSAGSHVGNDSKLVMRYSIDFGATWSNEKVVFDSVGWDDRNSVFGLVGNRFVVMFRGVQVGGTINFLAFVYSDDNGITWSKSNIINPLPLSAPFGKFYSQGDSTYCNFYTNSETSLRMATKDGSNWVKSFPIYGRVPVYKLVEPFIDYIGVDTLLCIMRDNTDADSSNCLQKFSFNNGATWTNIQKTNLTNGIYGRTPVVFEYDKFNKKIYLIAFSRMYGDTLNLQDTGYFYMNTPLEVISNSFAWNLKAKFLPKWNSTIRTYGYPTMVNISDKKYLVVYSERTTTNIPNIEAANLYQFNLNIPIDSIFYNLNLSDSIICLNDSVKITLSNLSIERFAISFNGSSYTKNKEFWFVPTSVNQNIIIEIIDSNYLNCGPIKISKHIKLENSNENQFDIIENKCEGKVQFVPKVSNKFTFNLLKNDTLVISNQTNSFFIENYTITDTFTIETIGLKCGKAISKPMYFVKSPIKSIFTFTNVGKTYTFNDISKNSTKENKWNFGDGFTDSIQQTINHTYQSNGNYTIKLIVKDSFNCVDTSIQSITVNNTLTNTLQEMGISIYPNPAKEYIVIENLKNRYIEDLKIYDINSKVVYTKSKIDKYENIDVSQLENGVYFILLDIENENLKYKLLIIK